MFVGGGWEPDTQKKVTAYAVSSVYVGGGLGTKKGENFSHASLHLHRTSSNELSVDLGARHQETRAADKLRTAWQADSYYCFIDIDREPACATPCPTG